MEQRRKRYWRCHYECLQDKLLSLVVETYGTEHGSRFADDITNAVKINLLSLLLETS